MAKKEHAKLSVCFEGRFPELFDFESCGLLMVDREDGGLFKVSMPDANDKENESDTKRMRTPIKSAKDAEEVEE